MAYKERYKDRGEMPPIKIAWKASLIGLIVGELVLLIIVNGGLRLADTLFGPSTNKDGGIIGVGTFLAVILGGFVASRFAHGKFGILQGTVVGCGFIVISAIFQFGQEASIVHTALQNGTHSIVDLGPMNIGNVFMGDFIALIGGSFGGWLARSRGDGDRRSGR